MSIQAPTLKQCPRCGEPRSENARTCSGCRYDFAPVPQVSDSADGASVASQEAGQGGASKGNWLTTLRQRLRGG